jgi:type IV secretion system protein VirB4
MFQKNNDNGYLDSDIIPYSCHIDESTILTSNGFIMKTIMFSGKSNGDLREMIQSKIKKIFDNSFSIWIHTIKMPDFQDEGTENSNKDEVSKVFYEIWNNAVSKKNDFRINTYVTITIPIPNFDEKNVLLKCLTQSMIDAHFHQNVSIAVSKINTVTNDFKTGFESLDPQELSIYEKDGILCSSYSEFLYSLVNLSNAVIPIDTSDMKTWLNVSKFVFGPSRFAVINQEKGTKKYCASISVKEYAEAPMSQVQKIIQSCQNVIVSQAIIPVTKGEIYNLYKDRIEILKSSNDEEFINDCGIGDAIKSITSESGEITMVSTQINISVFAYTNDELTKSLDAISAKFSEAGILCFIEDIYASGAFFSSFPCNFRFIARHCIMEISKVAGFAITQDKYSKENSNALWGKNLFPCIAHNGMVEPYYFDKDHASTCIIGPNKSGKSVLKNLITIMSKNAGADVIAIDLGQKSDVLASMYDMNFVNLSTDHKINTFMWNPFFDHNHKMMDQMYIKAFYKLLNFIEGVKVSVEDMNQDIDLILKSNPGNMIPNINKTKIANMISKYHGIGEFSHLMNMDDNSIKPNSIIYIDSKTLANKSQIEIIMFSILYQIKDVISRNKNILLTINDPYNISETKLVADMLDQIMVAAKNSNSHVVFCINSSVAVKNRNSQLNSIVVRSCQDLLMLPDETMDIGDDKKVFFNLSDRDVTNIMKVAELFHNGFVNIKDGNQKIIKMNIHDIDEYGEISSILSNSYDLVERLKGKRDKMDKINTLFQGNISNID